MTKTLIDRAELQTNFSSITELGALIKALEERFLSQGEVICQFKLNGLSISEADEKRLSQMGLHEIEFIEIESQSPQTLLFNLLDNWSKELPALMKNAEELAKEIRFKGLEGHLKAFVNLLDTCQFLMESFISLESIIKTSPASQVSWCKAEELTARAIGEALKTFEKKDFVLLSEILEYDLGHALQVWFDEISKLSQGLKDENAKDAKGFSERIFFKGT